MTIRVVACAAAAWLTLVGPAAADDPAPKPRVFYFDLALKRGDPLGHPRDGTVEILTRPQVMTAEKQEARVLIGQSFFVGGDYLDVGSTIAILPEATAAGKLRLRLTVELSELVASGDDHATVRADRYLCVREVAAGELVRIRLGPRVKTETWLELTAREVKK